VDGLIEIFLEHPSLEGKVGRDGYRFLFVVVRKYLISGINPFSLDDLVSEERMDFVEKDDIDVEGDKDFG
jgi:hypothetical protein